MATSFSEAPQSPVHTKHYARRIRVVTNKKPSDGLEDVDAALEAWARWGRSGLSGIGWSSWTLLARVIEQGFTGAAQKGGCVFEVDEAMELVERAVLRLAEIERRVICEYYLRWQPPEITAQRCHMSYGHFRVVLNRARRRIRDYLEGARSNCVSNI
jgi:hypothetical protein